MFERVTARVTDRLTSFEAADILRLAGLTKPFVVTDALAALVALIKDDLTPRNIGAHHQFVTAEAEDALCAVCGCAESENAPECRWN